MRIYVIKDMVIDKVKRLYWARRVRRLWLIGFNTDLIRDALDLSIPSIGLLLHRWYYTTVPLSRVRVLWKSGCGPCSGPVLPFVCLRRVSLAWLAERRWKQIKHSLSFGSKSYSSLTKPKINSADAKLHTQLTYYLPCYPLCNHILSHWYGRIIS